MTMIIDGTNGGFFPSWTTATRPSSPAVGQMGYNTTIGQFDTYTSNGWVSVLTTTSTTNKVPVSQMPSGSIIQTVNSTVSGDVGTTSTSYSSTNLFATITPTSASSKIICLASSNTAAVNTLGNAINYLLYRGTSGNGSGGIVGSNSYYWIMTNASTNYMPLQLMYVDSPASTSALTYTVMHKSANSGQNVGWCYGFGVNNLATMILMEVAP
jgi:hypothetical protein